ncbi:MAG: hypothetical protein ACO3JL_19050, partial [Myxococcota bacterium]
MWQPRSHAGALMAAHQADNVRRQPPRGAWIEGPNMIQRAMEAFCPPARVLPLGSLLALFSIGACDCGDELTALDDTGGLLRLA